MKGLCNAVISLLLGPLNIDNMEGIAAHRTPVGETILTLISGDNYSPLQRTLLMKFAVPDVKPVLAEAGAR